MQNYAVQTTDAQGVNWLFFVAANSSQDAIESALSRSWVVDDQNIQVRVNGNKVVLKGAVESLFEKDEAARLAWNAPGVNEVDNELAVIYEL
jgi:osmotically-inducible protein OsmY